MIYICDGTMTGIRKFEKFCETIRVIEERKEVQIMNKIQLLYNRYSSKNSMQMEKLPGQPAGRHPSVRKCIGKTADRSDCEDGYLKTGAVEDDRRKKIRDCQTV